MANPQRLPELLPGIVRREISYDVYRSLAENGDIALWVPRTISGWFIAQGTDGPFCHASGIVRAHGRLWQAGYEEGRHGYVSPLSAEVRRWTGTISIFRLRGIEATERVAIGEHYVSDLGGDYGWTNIRLIAWAHMLGLRWFTWLPAYRRAVLDRCAKTSSAICSQHIARSIRRATRRVLLRKDEALISPNDIARSPLLDYVGTLTWPEAWER